MSKILETIQAAETLIAKGNKMDALRLIFGAWGELCVSPDPVVFEKWVLANNKLKGKRIGLDWEAMRELLPNIKGNFWDFIPDTMKRQKMPERLTGYRLSPECKNLTKLLTPYFQDPSDRLILAHANFSQDGVVATDTLKLIYLPGNPEIEGPVCLTNECLKAVEKNRYGMPNFPDWKIIIEDQIAPQLRTTLEIAPLLMALKTIESIGITNDRKGESDFDIALFFGDEFIYFRSSLLMEGLTTFVQLGEDWIDVHFTKANKALLVLPTGKTYQDAKQHKTPLVLLMPVKHEPELQPNDVGIVVDRPMMIRFANAAPAVPILGQKQTTQPPKASIVKNKPHKYQPGFEFLTSYKDNADLGEILELAGHYETGNPRYKVELFDEGENDWIQKMMGELEITGYVDSFGLPKKDDPATALRSLLADCELALEVLEGAEREAMQELYDDTELALSVL